MNTASSKRGISPLISAIILIAIVIAIGAFLYTFAFSATRSAGSIGDAAITDMRLVKAANYVFTITVRNTGTLTFSDISVAVKGDNGGDAITLTAANFSPSISGLSPGKSASATYSGPVATGESLTVGRNYPVIVVVTFTDGSTKTISSTVTCETT